nr:ROK family protein [Oceanococcus sp. HetDA_MAG_MS8]
MRLGVDLGGTKIAGVVLDDAGAALAQARVATPQGDYAATLEAIAQLVEQLEARVKTRLPELGIGTPGTWDAALGELRGCNSTCLNGRAFKDDLQGLLQRPVQIANDANCLALSESEDGACAGLDTVFAVILGTGVGGGLVVHGKHWEGLHGAAGEWGHCPLPNPREEQVCWCGGRNCIESHLSGPALARRAGTTSVEALVAAIDAGDAAAVQVMDAWVDDLARALSLIINVIDPQAIVFGGGVSRVPGLLARLREALPPYVFSPRLDTLLRLSVHGDASGVRGAARLCSASPT